MVRMASLDGEGGRVFCPGPFGLMFYVFTVIEILPSCGRVSINTGNGRPNNEIVPWVSIRVGYGCL